MPPKRKVPASDKDCAKCAICSHKVTVSEDELLFCEGKCSGWMHRYCAGVSLVHYSELSNKSAGKFLCSSCYQHSQEEEVERLEANIAALTAELTELRSTVQRLESKCQPSPPGPRLSPDSPSSWSTVVKRGGSRGKGKGKVVYSSANNRTDGVQKRPSPPNLGNYESNLRHSSY